MPERTIGIGLMGIGVIGGQVAKVLTEKTAVLSERAGCPVVLRKIKVIESDLTRPQAQAMDQALFTTDEEDFFNTPDWISSSRSSAASIRRWNTRSAH